MHRTVEGSTCSFNTVTITDKLIGNVEQPALPSINDRIQAY